MVSEIWNLLNDVRKFIEAEYEDPSVAPDGEWLAKEARHIHNKVCTALANGSEALSRTGAVTEAMVDAALAEWSKPNDRRDFKDIMRASLKAAMEAGGKDAE